jgi:hypothetical protein
VTDQPSFDLEELLATLRHARAGKQYTPMDRYRDFRQVFLGSDQGKRVLWELLGFSHLMRHSHSPGDPYTTAFKCGEQNVGHRILFTLNSEPKEQPAKANSKQPKD